MARKPKTPTEVKTHSHQDKRTNIPPAEMEPLMAAEDKSPIRVAYERRNRDLDPQFVWRGKDEQDWSDLVVQAPPLYIQEKIHPKVLIDELLRETAERKKEEVPETPDLFGDFNGLPDANAAAEFYQHQANWTNRMILGDSLSVMASLAEREGLRGKVQCIYLDPPYGIKFNSNFQWSTTSREVKDGNANHVTREPEMVKAFRDTWRDGIHSYMTYLRDRLTVARDLLHESGSVFMQIGDENEHRVRALMDEVFGDNNFVSLITVSKTSSQTSTNLASTCDYIIWYTKDISKLKYRQLQLEKSPDDPGSGAAEYKFLWLGFGQRKPIEKAKNEERSNFRIFRPSATTSQSGSETTRMPVDFNGKTFRPGPGGWKTNAQGFRRLIAADRIISRTNSLSYVRFLDDYPVMRLANLWNDVRWGFDASLKTYVVQTNPRVVERCILMATDPGDLVLDPTCGSGTTAYVAEQWGRRWLTIDTSRVSLALARARIMGARYPFYELRDTESGVRKEAELRRSPPQEDRLTEVQRQGHKPDLRQGFVYERVPHIMLKDIANNAEIDVIWDKFQEKLEPLRERLNAALGQSWEDWEVPRDVEADWSDDTRQTHADWWEQRIARQREIDVSIAAKADYEYLYDKPFTDKGKIRVAGPFTVESLSPHRTLAVDHDDGLVDTLDSAEVDRDAPQEEMGFATMVMENLKISGVQQMEKGDRIKFSSVDVWAGGGYVAAVGRYQEGEDGFERRAGIFIGPEFGTVQRADLTAAARECAEAGFDILVACAFNYSAQCADLTRMGALPILRARMNPDLHMADDLKNTGTGNLFVVFGEPDIDLIVEGNKVRVKIKGVDVFKPQSGEIESSGPEGIACWFIDTDYNEESFFARHAYFLGASDPYKALKTTLNAEIDAEAWDSLHSDVSRLFDKPKTGRIAVKVINHLGDEVMKVFGV